MNGIVVRGCIGMAYPSKSPFTRRGLSLRESLTGVPEDTFPPNKIVHSDIDPYNGITSSLYHKIV
jgi:hypothetical protein